MGICLLRDSSLFSSRVLEELTSSLPDVYPRSKLCRDGLSFHVIARLDVLSSGVSA